MRVYVPTTIDGLRTLRDSGFQPPVAAHAVTPEVREWYVEGDNEELEYAAADEAAEASVRLLGAAGDLTAVVPRRVVVAADVPDAAARPGGPARSSVTVEVPVQLAMVASVHVDDADARDDVRAAARAVAAADAGDEDARADVEQAAGYELLWYDVSELDDVIALG